MLLTDFDASRQAVINPDMLFSPVPDLPETAVSCFSHVTFERMLNMAADVRVLAELGDANAKYPVYRGVWQGTPLTFALAMVGAPSCVAMLEELHALGAKRFVVFGNCGVLNQQIEGGPRTKHGGDDDSDNSGIIRYVRVEFAGYPFMKDKEINGITFGSVGSGTTIDHLQVSYSNDDSYEWFGGSVNCKYLVAYNGWDDEFDTDNGFSGKVQYGLSIRDPRIADTSQSNGFESDNCADGSLVSPYTTAVFSNITFIGPLGRDAGFTNDESYINAGSFNPNNGSALGKFQSAMQIRRSSRLNCFNSVAVGYPVGLIIDGEKGNTVEQAQEGIINLQNIWFAGMTVTGSDANKVYDDVLYDAVNKTIIDAGQESYSSSFFKAQKGNKVLADMNELNFKDGRGIGVNYMPNANSPVLTAASFDNALLDNGFDKVDYIGAFGINDNWLDGWTNFDPNNTDY